MTDTEQTSEPSTEIFPRRARRTISRDLILSLSAIVAATIAAVTLLDWQLLSTREERRFEEAAAQRLHYLQESLAHPLWSLDKVTIGHIADTALRDEDIARLKISDRLDQTLFERSKGETSGLVVKVGQVTFHESLVGSVELALTQRSFHKMQAQILRGGLLTCLLAIGVIVAATHFILGAFLRRPFAALARRMDAIAAGDYTPALSEARHREIEAILSGFNLMAEKVKDREDALRQGRERYRDLVEGANSVILRWDTQGRILFMNPFGLRLFGFTEEELIGRNAIGTIVPDFAQDGRDLGAMIRAIAERPSGFAQNENENICKDGRRVWINWTNKAVFDASGECREILSVGNDITERKRTEAALAAAHAQLRAVLDAVPDQIFVKDAEGRFLVVNESLARAVGASRPEEVLGKTDRDVFPSELAARYAADEREILRTGKPLVNLEEPSLDLPTGSPLWHLTTKVPIRNPEGAIVGTAGVSRDITERKQAEEALRAYQDRLEALLRASRTVMSGLDLQTSLEQIVAEASRISRCNQVKLLLVDREAQVLRVSLTQGLEAPPGLPWPLGYGLSGRVARTGEPVFIADSQDDALNPNAAFDREKGLRTYLGLPIKARGEVLGVLTFNTPDPHEYSAAEMAFLTSFADQAAIAIENARLYEAAQCELAERKQAEAVLRAHQARLEGLLQGSLELGQIQMVETLVGRIGEACARLLNADGGDVRIREGNDLVKIASWGDYQALGSLPRLKIGQGLSGVVAARGEPLLVEGLGEDERVRPPIRDAHLRLGHRAWLGVPAKIGDRLVATLNMWTRRDFSTADVNLASAFAAQVAIAIENARLFREEQRRREQLEAVRLVSAEIARELDLDRLLGLILQRAMDLVGGTAFTILIWDETSQQLIPSAYIGEFSPLTLSPVPSGEGMVGRVAASRQGLIINNYQAWEGARPQIQHLGIRAALAEPLIFHGKLIGVVNIASTDEQKQFTNQDSTVLRLLADQAAIAIENARLFEAAQRDLAERTQAEAEARRLRNYLANIVNSMPSVLVGVDREGRVTQWNAAAAQATGLTPAEALGQPLRAVFPRLEAQLAQIRAALDAHQIQTETKVPRTTEDETRYEDITVYPLVTNGVEGAVIRLDDVTERVRLEELMIQSEKMLSVGGLAAGMAHEINNPLGVILQAAQNSLRRVAPDLPANTVAAAACGTTVETIRRYLEQREVLTFLEDIRASGQRAAEIVANMLSFSRKPEGGGSSTDLAALLDRTLALAASDYDLKKQHDFRQIAIVREYDPDVPPVLCQSSKIQQVFLNLLRNGAEAMRATAALRPPQLTLRVRRESPDWVRVEIADTGPGMDEATRRRVFEPFFTTKAPGVGTGLGLSVSYFIVTEDHGGTLSVESSPGSGATFVLRLPVAGKRP